MERSSMHPAGVITTILNMSSTKVVAAGKCNTIGCSKWTFGCGLKCKHHAPPTNVFTLTKRVVEVTPGKRTAGVACGKRTAGVRVLLKPPIN